MFDILMPVPIQNATLVPDALVGIVKTTDVPFRVVVVVDGGARDDLHSLEAFLGGFDHPWKLMHNNPAVGLNQCIRDGLAECAEKLTAIIGPEVRILDDRWYGKMQQIFAKDPITGIVDTVPDTKSATMYPIKRAVGRPAPDDCRFMLVQTAFAKKTLPYGDVDPSSFWSRSVMWNSGASWYAPGVRYIEVEHQDHDLWRAPLGVRS